MAVRPPAGNLEEDAQRDSYAGHESKEYYRLDELEAAKHAVAMAIHWALRFLVPASIFLAFIIFWIGIIIYALHLFGLGWLEENQLHELRAVLFSGVVGAVVSQGIKRYLD